MHTWNTQDIAIQFVCMKITRVIFHSTGKTLRLEDFDMDQLARWMISTTRESARCIYENDDILVEHRISTYKRRKKCECKYTLKDGLLWRTETGVTPLSKKDRGTQ